MTNNSLGANNKLLHNLMHIKVDLTLEMIFQFHQTWNRLLEELGKNLNVHVETPGTQSPMTHGP